MKKKIGLWVTPFLFLLLAAAWCVLNPGCSRSGETSLKSYPNIVLIIVDALRADKLGCYGFPGKTSPEIDVMAREGIVFEDVLAQCSWTRPAIASMVTALYPRSIGIYKEKYDILPDKYLTLAEVLKDNGYRTYGITANPNINKIFNFHQGFDEYEDSAIIWKWMKDEQGKKKADDDAHLPRSKEVFAEVLKKTKSYGPEPVYIQINIMEVHSPYLIRDEYKDAFKDYPVKKTNVKYPAEKLTKLVRGTLAAVRQVSYDIGDFVQNFRALPGRENTLFVITSDHGQGLDDHPDVHGSQVHGNLLYRSHLQVPLIFYHPGKSKKIPVPHPHRVKEKVRLLDLMPTLLDYVGISPPGEKHIHGRSLINLITGKGKKPHLQDFFIAETNWRKVNKIALYSGKWQYFENKDDWEGVNKRELQPVGITENGKQTDKIHEESETGKKMKRILFQWEKKYKRAKPIYPEGSLTKKEIQQLKTLGYLN